MSERGDVVERIIGARAVMLSLGHRPRQVRLGKRQVHELEQLFRCELGHGRLQLVMGLRVVESAAEDLLTIED